MKSKIEVALGMVEESRPHMSELSREERKELERIARQKISEGAKATLRKTVYGRRIAKMLGTS